MSDLRKQPTSLDQQIVNLLELASSDVKAGRNDEAISLYNSVLGLNPQLAHAWFLKGVAVFKSSTLGNCRFLESKPYFEKALSISDTEETRMAISETIASLAIDYFPAYEQFFKDHFKAPSSVESLFSTYNEFDQMIYWATEICPSNHRAFETGWDLCRQIIEMPKKYVNDQKWSAFGAEMGGEGTGEYGNGGSAKIDRERATAVKNKLETYSKRVLKNAKKYEKGIKGIPELKKLIKHFDQLIGSKPKVSSEGKNYPDWNMEQTKENNYMAIAGGVFEALFIYNWYDNNWEITFWSLLWFGIGLYLLSRPFLNKPTQEKYNLQQGELSKWVTTSHEYIHKTKLTSTILNKLGASSKGIYKSYYYFNSLDKAEGPSVMVKKIKEAFFDSNAQYKFEPV